MTSQIRQPDRGIWVSVAAMTVCGLSIGQPCVVNDTHVMMSWPAKLKDQTSVALTASNMELLGLDQDAGSAVSVKRFTPTRSIADVCVLRMR